ncbi:MAG: hypothetical protein R3B47_04035 [Bacteroidia bacterium]
MRITKQSLPELFYEAVYYFSKNVKSIIIGAGIGGLGHGHTTAPQRP